MAELTENRHRDGVLTFTARQAGAWDSMIDSPPKSALLPAREGGGDPARPP